MSAPQPGAPSADIRRLRGLVVVTGILLICFSRPLVSLVQFALHGQLYSYIVLVPFISLYLVWIKRKNLPPASGPAVGVAGAFGVAGLAVLGGYWFAGFPGADQAPEDSLALTSLAFVLLFLGACALFLGGRRLRALAFPLGFLVFLIPMPSLMVEEVEHMLQLGSAAAAIAFFRASGTALFYHDLIFQLPGFSLQIAPECSGIHSSLVLFITSLLAGHLFLRSPWKRSVLALAVIPLALLRNGFRVFVIGELCVHVGPQMIDSYIHRKGGPIFFVLSLVPFFLLLLFLLKSERSAARGKPPAVTIHTSDSDNPTPLAGI